MKGGRVHYILRKNIFFSIKYLQSFCGGIGKAECPIGNREFATSSNISNGKKERRIIHEIPPFSRNLPNFVNSSRKSNH
jgi:hypothetical protein